MKRPQLIPYQCWTAAAGVLLLLPLQAISLPLLFVLPGLSFYVLYKAGRQLGILEGISYSISLTLVLLPTTAALLYLANVSVGMTGAAFGLVIITVSVLSFVFQKNSAKLPENDTTADPLSHRWVRLSLPILLAVVLALVVSIPLAKSFVASNEGLVMNPTEASDLNFHLSIIARYVESPRSPRRPVPSFALHHV